MAAEDRFGRRNSLKNKSASRRKKGSYVAMVSLTGSIATEKMNLGSVVVASPTLLSLNSKSKHLSSSKSNFATKKKQQHQSV